jgi:hypothetical protein
MHAVHVDMCVCGEKAVMMFLPSGHGGIVGRPSAGQGRTVALLSASRRVATGAGHY